MLRKDINNSNQGWSDGQGKNARYTAVLEIPPENSLNTAVRAALVAKSKK